MKIIVDQYEYHVLWCLKGYTLPGLTFLLKPIMRLRWQLHQLLLSNYHSVHWLLLLAAPTVTICIVLSYGLVPVFRVPYHACAWCDSSKMARLPSPGSLLGWMWFGEHLDLKLGTSPWQSPDCQFTWHTLVDLSVDPLTSCSWRPYANLSWYSYGDAQNIGEPFILSYQRHWCACQRNW